jgi:hypothetical protein
LIGKITGGASFGGALEYLTQPKERGREQEGEERLKATRPEPDEHAPPYGEGERHRVIGGNLSGQSREEMAEEFEAIRRQRPDITKPVHHASLSVGESDRLTVRQWNEIAAKYVEQMGFKDAPFVVIQHRDGKMDHVHILTSRVDVRGKVVSEWQSKARAEKVLRGIEREYGLEQVKSSREVERAAPKRGEIERFSRTGELSAKMSLQSHVDLALKDGPTVAEFIDRLQLSGIETIPYVQKSGRVSGISFRKGKQLMKGSDLGHGFSWNALRERGMDYQPERDRPAIEAARERATLEREVSASTPERSFIDLPKDAGREVGQYLLDQANPIKQIENKVYLSQQTGKEIVDGVTALRDLVTNRNDVQQLSKPSGFNSNERDAIERLQQAAGVEPVRDGDPVERLSRMIGLDKKDPADPTHTLDKSLQPMPELVPALEHEAEEHVLAPVIDLMF